MRKGNTRGRLKWAGLFTATTLAMTGPAMAASADLGALTQEARQVVKAFTEAMGGRMKAAVEAGGLVGGIELCNAKAPAVTATISSSSGWKVGRTGPQVRNPVNAPDAWERAALEDFARRAQAGESLAAMERTEVVDDIGHRRVRYMKAIATGEACVACHGTSLKPEVSARLDALYPQDQGRGFKPGDLRGAFTLSKPLD